jgi:HSP20 family molecular chaperone IbpA
MVRNLIPRRDDVFFPIEQVFDDFFKDFFKSNPIDRVRGAGGFPKMDAYEQDGQFVVSVATSGMKPEDIQVEVTPDHMLIIRGRVNEEHRSDESAAHYLRELRSSAFERQVRLPDHVQGDPKAVMKDGLLKLTWITAKVVEPDVRRIAIETG